MKNKLLAAAGAVLGIAFAAVCFFSFCRFGFTYISYADGKIIIDDNDRMIRIFRMNGGFAESRIEYEKIANGDSYNLVEKICEDNGVFYLVNYHNTIGYLDGSYDVYILDFDRKEMERRASYSLDEIDKVIAGDGFAAAPLDFFAENGTLYLKAGAYQIGESGGAYREYLLSYNGERWTICGKRPSAYLFRKTYRTKNGGSVFLSSDGNVVLSDKTGEERRMSEDIYTDLFRLNDTEFIGKNLSEKSLFLIDAVSGTVVPYLPDAQNIPEFSLIRGVFTEENSAPRVVCYGSASSYICDLSDGTVVRSISLESAPAQVVCCVSAFAAPFVLLRIIALIVSSLKAHGRVVMKFIAAVIPIILVCDLTLYLILKNVFRQYNYNSLCKSLISVGEQYDALRLNDGITDFGEPSAQLYEMQKALWGMRYFSVNHSAANKNALETEVDFYGRCKRQDVYCDIYGAEGIESVDAMYEPVFRSAFESAVSSGEPTSCEGYDIWGELMTYVIYPVYTACESDGGIREINGAYIISASEPEADHEAGVIMKKILLCEILLSLIIAAVFSAVTAAVLYPLKSLRKKSTDFLSGRRTAVSVKPKRKYSDEISVISDRFDELVLTANNYFEKIIRLRTASRAYFSDGILNALGRKNISQIRFNESAVREMYVLTAFLPGEYSDFDKINRLLKNISERLGEYGAFAEAVDNTGFSVFSRKPRLINEVFLLHEYDSDIRVVFDKCPVEISVMGSGENYRFSAVCADRKRAGFLAGYCRNAGVQLAVTEFSVDPGEFNFSKTCVGMIGSEHVFEVSELENDSKRRLISGNMKEAVELFFSGEKQLARNAFAEVLKRDGENPAARYYIDLIDGFYER